MEDFNIVLVYLLASVLVLLLFSIWHAMRLKWKREEVKGLHWLGIILWGVVMNVVYRITVFPVDGLHCGINRARVNLIPFLVFQNSNQNNLYGNILMFVPIGILLVFLSRDYGKWYKIPMIGAGISISIEVLQLFMNRASDIDDVLLNTCGTIIGGIVAKLLLFIFPGLKGQMGIFKAGTRARRKKDGKYLLYLAADMLFVVLIIGELQYVVDRNETSSEQYFNVAEEIQQNTEDAEPVMEREAEEEETISSVDLEASNVYFFNTATQTMIYANDESEKIAPASTTKMLTALVVVEFCDLDEMVTVGDEIDYVTSDASVAGLWYGCTMNVEAMLSAMLLPSGNDAAYVLAAYTGRRIANDMDLDLDSAIQEFIDQMNVTAEEMGATDSYFMRPDGYDASGQFTTAYDLGLIAQAFMKNDTLREISGSESIRCICEDGTDLTFKNTDELICSDSEYYQNDVIGGKTGSSGEAGKCLVSAAMIQNQMYIAVVMGDSDEGRWKDSIRLYDLVR